MKEIQLTAKLTRKEVARLRAIAAFHGLVIGRGPIADQGSVRKLLRALAAGDLRIVVDDASTRAALAEVYDGKSAYFDVKS